MFQIIVAIVNLFLISRGSWKHPPVSLLQAPLCFAQSTAVLHGFVGRSANLSSSHQGTILLLYVLVSAVVDG